MEQNGITDNPRPVSRGLKLHPAFLGVDSLYLVLEYPHVDVYQYWSGCVADMKDRRLYDGVPHGDMLIRRGGLGYQLSVWLGDARLFITNRVDDELSGSAAAGQGMGVMLQLGSKWLRLYADFTSYETLSAAIFTLLEKFHVTDAEKYPLRINRLDVALDVRGLGVAGFSVDEWRQGWVGRAKSKTFHDDSSGQLSGGSVGSSKGSVRFKFYDKVLESGKDNDFLFWLSVWELPDLDIETLQNLVIARFEWSFKPHQAKFTSMRYLSDYSFDGLKELMNYATLEWGRLCIPQDDDNHSRWELHPLWVDIRRMLVDEWSVDQAGVAKREYHLASDLNPSYLSSVTGWLGGLLARVGLHKGYDQPADIYEAVMLAQEYSEPITDKAAKKWAILSRLQGKQDD